MAVVSISRIQIRRGRENTGTGLPQLASGELGWAIDSQSLYIGNGSVAEGSPYVGNTKLLSEHDNLFEFARNYTLKGPVPLQTGPNENDPVIRTLQERLDDNISVRSFGIRGNGDNVTVPLQRAIDQLFLNTNKNNPQGRQVLTIEAGDYLIDGPIYLPPHTTIKGAGKDKTVIRQVGAFSTFITCNGDSTPGNYNDISTDSALNQPRRITLSGMTIQSQAPGAIIELQSCKDSSFKDMKLEGTFANGDSSYSDSTFTDHGILMTAASTAVTCEANRFEDVEITKVGYAVRSKFDIKNNHWTNCKFRNCGHGFEFGEETLIGVGGQLTGPINNLITECIFDTIDRHGIWITNGENNLSRDNKFYSVGNNSGIESNATYSVINFVAEGNQSDNDWFSRTADLAYNQTFINGSKYIPEVQGKLIYNSSFTEKVVLSTTGTFEKLFRLPADTSKAYVIDYIYVSNAVDAKRHGTLQVTIDPVLNTVNLTDDYDFLGDSAFEENLELRALLVDEDIDSLLDTLAITVLNSTANDDAEFYYRVTTKI